MPLFGNGFATSERRAIEVVIPAFVDLSAFVVCVCWSPAFHAPSHCCYDVVWSLLRPTGQLKSRSAPSIKQQVSWDELMSDARAQSACTCITSLNMDSTSAVPHQFGCCVPCGVHVMTWVETLHTVMLMDNRSM